MPNKGAAGNRHRAFSFDESMKFELHHCSQRQAPVAVPELDVRHLVAGSASICEAIPRPHAF